MRAGDGPFLSGSRRDGTRFRLFPQPPFGDAPGEPETVWLSPAAGSLGPGPSDDRMRVVDPIGKLAPYGLRFTPYGRPYLYLPPWRGPLGAPVAPDAQGHFDQVEIGSPEFEAAHAYGCVRFVLDVWERYFGQAIAWHFARDYRQLEISLLRSASNAFAGYGFLELGADMTESGAYRPFSLSFDIVAHEVGHLMVYSQVGLPREDAIEGEYFGFHESAADLVALVAVLHFDSVLDRLLEMTSGNLYTFNELNRFAELSEDEQIRIAGNGRHLFDFAAGWSDEHDLSEPLTGSMFDIFVDIFHEALLERRLIDPQVEDLFDQLERDPEFASLIQSMFDEAYARDPAGFRDALLETRDYLGAALAMTWQRLSPDSLNYVDVGEALLAADRRLSGGRYRRAILNNLTWRGIGLVQVGPRLAPPTGRSHAFSARTLVPERHQATHVLSYRERWQLARTR
jgi:hypothetical protein